MYKMSKDNRQKFVSELSQTDLSPNSIKLYSIKLNKLSKEVSILSEEEIVKNKKKIIKYVDSIEGRDSALSTLNALLKITKNDDLKNLFIIKRNELNRKKFEAYKDNKKSKNFVEYKDLLEATKDIDYSDIWSNDWLDGFLAYFNVRYPLRLALWDSRITYTKKGLDDSKNYIYIGKQKSSLILNSFKNVKSMGPQELAILPKDDKVIREYIKQLKMVSTTKPLFLFNRYKMKSISPYPNPDVYGLKLKSILKKELGKDFTMNDIRKSYESELIQSDRYKDMTNEQKIKEHAKLLHGYDIAHSVYNKV